MARRTASTGLSPRLLKHFAAATVVLTAVLAILASGEDWGAKAQVDAIEAKNQLSATEAEKLGTRKVAATLKVANDVGAASFGDDEGGFGGNGGGGYAPRVEPQPAAIPAQLAPSRRTSPFGNPLDPTRPPQPPGSEQAPAVVNPSVAPSPTAQDIANITASSARRAGGSGSGD